MTANDQLSALIENLRAALDLADAINETLLAAKVADALDCAMDIRQVVHPGNAG